MNTSKQTTDAATPPKNIGRKIAIFFAALIVLIMVVFVLGPRNSFGPDTPTPRDVPPDNPAQLDEWLKQKESAYTDLRPETAKSIVWASADKQKTPWSIVYLHGFGSSHLETYPLAPMIAKQMGANLFQSRLSGHGRSGAAMAEPSPQDWLADLMEAVRIGRTIGERVLLIGCSTGATLGTWLAVGAEAHLVDAYTFISPNYGPLDKSSEIINLPWGQQIGTAIVGETYSWTAPYKRVEVIWTSSHPTKALFPMMALVKHVRGMDLSAFKTPVLMLYSERDQVVDPAEIKKAFARISSPIKQLENVTYSTAATQHVLAGDSTAPESSAQMAESISRWIQALPRSAKSL